MTAFSLMKTVPCHPIGAAPARPMLRRVMAPNICSILERVPDRVRFPCFSHEVNG